MLIINNKALKVGNKWLNPVVNFDEVTIGTQIWKSVNLAIDDGGTGIKTKDNVIANGVNFGTQYYYTWDAAVRIANSITGWHLPSKSEWETLVDYAGGGNTASYKLRSTSGWNENNNGADVYGFSVIPVGYKMSSDNGTYEIGWNGNLWSSTEDSDTSKAYYTSIGQSLWGNWYLDTSYKGGKSEDYYTVRLIKDT